MLIGKVVIAEEQINDLITAIRKKKELAQLSEDFVRDHLVNYLTNAPSKIKFLENPKSKVYKQVVKDLRAVLRRLYGLFRIEEDGRKRRDLVEKYVANPSEKLLGEILQTHSSTKERLPYYAELYKRIFSITGKPKSILDLGCGINPFSVLYMKLDSVSYHAYDISNDEVDLLQFFFTKINCKADIKVLDIQKSNHFPQVDVAFLFKMTDVLDRGRGHKATEEVLSKIPAKYVVVSFPTVTMSNKKMRFPRRKWIELMCRRLSYTFKTVDTPNEIFYIIKKFV